MKMTVSKLAKFFVVEKLIYHSVDLSLYIVSAIVEGDEYYLTDDKALFSKRILCLNCKKY